MAQDRATLQCQVSPDLHYQLKLWALQNRIHLADMIREGVDMYLKEKGYRITKESLVQIDGKRVIS